METRSAKKRKLSLLNINSNEEEDKDKDKDEEKDEEGENEDEEDEDLKVDRISDLPDDLLHCILQLLPIKSAAQTTVLSQRWKTIFPNIPDLDFRTVSTHSHAKIRCSKMDREKRMYLDSWNNNPKDLKFIPHVLNLRPNNSSLRTLKLRGSLTFTDLHSIFKYVSKHDIQEIDMDIHTEDHFNFPRSIVGCDSLKILRLRSRYIGFRINPSTIIRGGGFKSIHTMTLSQILFHFQPPTLVDLFTDSTFPRLKNLLLDSCSGLKELNFRCSRLENLFLRNIHQLHILDIVGLKLERLNVDCCFSSSDMNNKVIINAPVIKHVEWIYSVIIPTIVMDKSILLETTVINLFQPRLKIPVEPIKRHNLSHMIAAFSNTRSLTLESGVIQVLTKIGEENILVNKFESLSILEIEIGYDKFSNGFNNYPAIATLFENSPYVQALVITTTNIEKIQRRPLPDLRKYATEDEDKYWGDRVSKMNSFFNHLKIFKFDGFLECDKDIRLVMFMIKHGVVLEEVILCLGQGKTRQMASKERIRSMIMSFTWASSQGKGTVVFE